jgi:hypothetical protein
MKPKPSPKGLGDLKSAMGIGIFSVPSTQPTISLPPVSSMSRILSADDLNDFTTPVIIPSIHCSNLCRVKHASNLSIFKKNNHERRGTPPIFEHSANSRMISRRMDREDTMKSPKTVSLQSYRKQVAKYLVERLFASCCTASWACWAYERGWRSDSAFGRGFTPMGAPPGGPPAGNFYPPFNPLMGTGFAPPGFLQ